MSYFLLPKSLCSELERITARIWWQKSPSRRGIHWTAWRNLCHLKERGGLGFRNLCQFNIALLAKQGWRILFYPNSLLERVLKDKYFPHSDFLNANLGNLPSLTWKNVWAAKRLLQDGLCFPVDVAQKILRIPLAETPHEDFKVWMGEQSGDFLVRSAYKLLQDVRLDPNFYLIQTDLKDFYGKLWNLQLPAKIAITIWRTYWNYIPTLANLKHKRVSNDAVCPRCGRGEEDITHIFRYCPGFSERVPLSSVRFTVVACGFFGTQGINSYMSRK